MPAFSDEAISELTFLRGDLWIEGSCPTPAAFTPAAVTLTRCWALLPVVLDLNQRPLPQLGFHDFFRTSMV